MIALIVAVASRRGPSDRFVSALSAGGGSAVEVLSDVLSHAIDVLEQASMSSPRKSRKVVLELMESVDEVSEQVDEDWCDGISRCGSDRLGSLVSRALAVQSLTAERAETDAVSTCLLYTSPSPRDATLSRMPSSA